MTEDELALEECRRWLEEVVDIDCRSGAFDEASIVEAAAEIIEEELGAPHPELLRELTERARAGLAAHEQAERTWRERTVNDAIESAFAALADRGFLAAETLGSTVQEGWARAHAMAADLPHARACVFFHRQDLERAVRGEGLHLAFGPLRPDGEDASAPAPVHPSEPGDVVRIGIQRADVNPVGGRGGDDEAARAIGREIVAVLKHYGVDAEWSGSARTRIAIPPFAWQRRRLTKAPPAPAPPPLTADLGALPPEPPPPPACPDCQGRGFLPPLREGWGSDLCWCQGGTRPRPAAPAEATAASSPAAPEDEAPSSPAAAAEETAPPSPAEEPPVERGGVRGWIKRWFS